MTPFLDEYGAQHVIDLFKRCNDKVKKNLIVRFLDETEGKKPYQRGFHDFRDSFKELSVHVFDFSLAKESNWKRETFHAKVISCDNKLAYVGSSNMNRHSISGSMELGVFLKKKDAETIKQLLYSIMEISRKYNL